MVMKNGDHPWVKLILAVLLSVGGGSWLLYHQKEISELWQEMGNKVDEGNAPPVLYQKYVDSKIEGLQLQIQLNRQAIQDNKQLLQRIDSKLDRHMERSQ